MNSKISTIRIILKSLSIVLILLLSMGLTSCNKENKGEGKKLGNSNTNNKESEEYIVDESDLINSETIISDNVSGKLTTKEKEGLIRMREEEKLAYDVYVTLYKKWRQKIFNNISKSEKTHMTAVGDLLKKYNIEDPINLETKVGEFKSTLLQKLYDDLIASGNKSLVDALKVGATIEDLDIYDLEEFLKETKNEDIIKVYENLLRGSRNHMRAFNKNLNKKGGNYTAQYITQAHYDEIIGGKQEKGKGNK